MTQLPLKHVHFHKFSAMIFITSETHNATKKKTNNLIHACMAIFKMSTAYTWENSSFDVLNQLTATAVTMEVGSIIITTYAASQAWVSSQQWLAHCTFQMWSDPLTRQHGRIADRLHSNIKSFRYNKATAQKSTKLKAKFTVPFLAHSHSPFFPYHHWQHCCCLISWKRVAMGLVCCSFAWRMKLRIS